MFDIQKNELKVKIDYKYIYKYQFIIKMFTIIIPTALFCSIASVLGNDYLKVKHNRRLVKTMDKESRKLRKMVIKKTKNIKDKFQKNLMINSEIDNYVFKKQYRIRTFSTTKISQRNLNKYLRIHYYIFQKLKKDLLDEEYYEKLRHTKRDEIVSYINELDLTHHNTTTKVIDFIYYHEHLLLNYNEEVEELFEYCDKNHVFIGLQKHKQPTSRKVLHYFL